MCVNLDYCNECASANFACIYRYEICTRSTGQRGNGARRKRVWPGGEEGHSKLRTHWVKATTQEGSILWQPARAFSKPNKTGEQLVLRPGPLHPLHPLSHWGCILSYAGYVSVYVSVFVCSSDSVSKSVFQLGWIPSAVRQLDRFSGGCCWLSLVRLNLSGHAIFIPHAPPFSIFWNLWMLLTLLIAVTRRLSGLFSSSIQQRRRCWRHHKGRAGVGHAGVASGLHVDTAQLKLTFRETSTELETQEGRHMLFE